MVGSPSQSPIVHDKTYCWTVEPSDNNQRVDQYLSDLFPHYSRSFFQRLVEDAHVTINGKAAEKSGKKLRGGDVVSLRVPPPPTIDQQAVQESTREINILHEHPHFLVIYKPAGLLVHAPHVQSNEPSVVDWIKQHYQDIAHVGTVDRPGIVHRLDKCTSGVLIIPRTNYAYTVFSDMFRNRIIHKTYYALVEGHPPRSGTIDCAIGRHPIHRIMMASFAQPDPDQKIRHALTHYAVETYFEKQSLVKLMPVTGRTHQLRVHMASMGHPIVGDHVYGKSSALINRVALHAHTISFSFDGVEYAISHPFPSDFSHAINHL